MIESHGITDTIARSRYGAEGTFDLAERVFAPVMALRQPRSSRPAKDSGRSPEAVRGRVADLARGPFALAPLVVLLCIVQAFSEVGWGRGRLLALSLGMTMSVALANGFVAAIARRVALYLGLGHRGLARRLLDAGLLTAAASIAILGALAYVAARTFGLFAADERLVFLAALVCFTGLGLGIATLSIARATGWLCVGLAAGLAAALATRSLAGTGTGSQLLLALGAGLGVALAVLLAAARHVYGPRRSETALPPRSQLVLESAGYFAYGLAFMVFLLEVHVLGWLGTPTAGQSRLDAFTALEVALTLALPPVILASGVAERTLRLFWRHAAVRQEQVAARHVRRYGQALVDFHKRRLLVYLLVSAALAVGMLVAFELALRSGALGDWVALPDPGATEFVFVAALIAFWLVGWAQFNCMFVLNLGRPEQAFRPVLLAMVVAAATGIPLGAAAFDYTALAFVAGSAFFVWASARNCRRVLAAADHHYATAF